MISSLTFFETPLSPDELYPKVELRGLLTTPDHCYALKENEQGLDVTNGPDLSNRSQSALSKCKHTRKNSIVNGLAGFVSVSALPLVLERNGAVSCL